MIVSDLSLSKLPDRTPVKITISISPNLNRALNDYAALYQESYGQAEPVSELIPAMLASFLQKDRSFARRRRGVKSSGSS
jgi:hypothetical protein